MLPRVGLITPEYFRDYILPHVIYQAAEFTCYRLDTPEVNWVMKIERPVMDARTGRLGMQKFHGFLYGGFATEDDAVKFIFKTIKDMETHEAGEWFHYHGERIYDPHR